MATKNQTGSGKVVRFQEGTYRYALGVARPSWASRLLPETEGRKQETEAGKSRSVEPFLDQQGPSLSKQVISLLIRHTFLSCKEILSWKTSCAGKQHRELGLCRTTGM